MHRRTDVLSAVLHKEEVPAFPVAPSLARGFAERLPVFIAVLLQKLACILIATTKTSMVVEVAVIRTYVNNIILAKVSPFVGRYQVLAKTEMILFMPV